MKAKVIAVKFVPEMSEKVASKLPFQSDRDQPIFESVGLSGATDTKLINGKCEF